MGTADILPGVSGGTIALVLGVYKELIKSIDSINVKNLRELRNNGFKRFWEKINGRFLTLLFTGILTALFSLSFALDWLITNHPIPLWSFFLGLLISSIFILKNSIKKWGTINLSFVILSSILSFLLTQITPNEDEIGVLYLFISGFIGIIAMILPGLSGAYILLILGAYTTIVGLIKDVVSALSKTQIDIFIPAFFKLTVFAMGTIIGLRIFASVLKWLFNKEHDKTMAVLIGLMIGALHKIWPWQEKFKMIIGENSKIQSKPISPFEYPENPQVILAFILFISGLGIVWIIECNSKQRPQSESE